MKSPKTVKYFLDCDDWILYSVPKKYWNYIDIINNAKDDNEINDAKIIIEANCEPKLRVHAMTQML